MLQTDISWCLEDMHTCAGNIIFIKTYKCIEKSYIYINSDSCKFCKMYVLKTYTYVDSRSFNGFWKCTYILTMNNINFVRCISTS